MPVVSETLNDLDMIFDNHSLLGNEFYDETTPIQEIWKKFEVLDDVPLNEFFLTGSNAFDDPIFDSIDCAKAIPIGISNHDCMWAGHCFSKDHVQPHAKVMDDSCVNRSAVTPVIQTPSAPIKRSQQSTNSRSLLINSKHNQQIKNNIRHDHSFSKTSNELLSKLRYETPEVSSEDDSMDCSNPQLQLQQIVEYITNEKQTVMQILSNALTEMPDDNSGLGEYMCETGKKTIANSVEDSSSATSSSSESSTDDDEDEDDSGILPTTKCNSAMISSHMSMTPDHAYHKSAESDHCYYISNEPLRRDYLGVDTPSDSEEEEIDVVNVYGDTHQMMRNYQKAPLPTNPSSYDRKSLQRTMVTAINKRRTIKTRTPTNGLITPLTPATTPPYRQTSTRLDQQQATNQTTATTTTTTPTTTPINSQHQTQHQQQRATKKRGATSEPARTAKSVNSGGGGGGGVKRARQTYRQRRKRASGDSDSDLDSDKRNLHNDMERQRRVDLRNAFDDLRMLLPTVCHKERAAKVNILRDAAVHCQTISEQEEELKRTKAEEKKHQEVLMARVSYLRRMLAAKR